VRQNTAKSADKKPRTGTRKQDRAVAERKCLVTGASGPKHKMIRFVVGPDGDVVPDLGEKLPGRGLWVTSDRVSIEKAASGGLFSRAAKGKVVVADGLADRVQELLERRVLDRIGHVRKAGFAINGFEKVADCVEKGRAAVLLEASDGAQDGRIRLLRQARRRNEDHNQPIQVSGLLNSAELSLAFGQQHVIHAALKTAPVTTMALRDLVRLSGFRPMAPSTWGLPDDSDVVEGADVEEDVKDDEWKLEARSRAKGTNERFESDT
jgi:hypothetical protein